MCQLLFNLKTFFFFFWWMFVFDILTSTESSILSTDHHGRDLWVTQGSLHGLCNAMTHCRTMEKEQMDLLKSLLLNVHYNNAFQGHFVFIYVEVTCNNRIIYKRFFNYAKI